MLAFVDSDYVFDNPYNVLWGTSYASPYVAGMAAVACEAAGTACDTTPVSSLFMSFKNAGTMGTVLNEIGGPLVGSPSRVIWHGW